MRIIVIDSSGNLDPSIEDNGQAQILTVYGDPDVDEGLFVRIHSWSEGERGHPEMDRLTGHRLRVTIEILD